jgi:hypothetical protein
MTMNAAAYTREALADREQALQAVLCVLRTAHQDACEAYNLVADEHADHRYNALAARVHDLLEEALRAVDKHDNRLC